MGEEEEKIQKEVEVIIEKETFEKSRPGESVPLESIRDIPKMQAPEPWPDPPEDIKEGSSQD